MRTNMCRAPLLLVLGLAAGVIATPMTADPTPPPVVDDSGEYSELPKDFIIGAGSSSIQIESMPTEGGKGISIIDWMIEHAKDVFPESVKFHFLEAPGHAADSYHRYKEDVAMVSKLKLQAYRFSVSWARLFPDGDINKPNMDGVQFYNNLINELLAANIQPVVTMLHFDFPQAVMVNTGGWTNRKMVDAFEEYAGFLFKTFGDRVKWWTSINEPNLYCSGMLVEVPNVYKKQPGDDYKCIHHTVLAHAAAYNLYKREYKDKQKGQVGAAALTLWATPNTTTYEDIQAAERTNLFTLGIIYGPLVHGDYPELLKKTVHKFSMEEGLKESRLPSFTPEEQTLIKGAADFLSFNAYFSNVMADNSHAPRPTYGDMNSDKGAVEIGDTSSITSMKHMFEKSTPRVLREATMWIRDTYDMPIFITENGWGDESDHPLHDNPRRAAYHSEYLRELIKTIKDEKVNVIGYLMWSLLDSWEWSAKHTRHFGLVHVDYEGGSLNRTLKDSAWFFQHIGEHRRVPVLTFPRDSSSGTLALPSLHAVLAALAALLWMRH